MRRPSSNSDTFMTPLEIPSARIGGTRRIWLQPPITAPAIRCVTLLDGELYLERVRAPAIVEKLQRDGNLPPTTFVYVSSLDAAARHRDFTCNEDYTSFLVHDVLPWIERSHGRFEWHYLGGLSLSGLAAAFAILRYPGVFAGGLCQSPSAWWNGEWLTSSIANSSQGRFWISVGDQEVQKDINHPPTGLYQGASQLDSVRRLNERLRETRCTVRSLEFCGGHDPLCWASELPAALRWLMTGEG
jgi:enterochelin esterase family protein